MNRFDATFYAVLNKVGEVSPKTIAMIETMVYSNRSVKDIVKAVKMSKEL